jgi:hypothetical protein
MLKQQIVTPHAFAVTPKLCKVGTFTLAYHLTHLWIGGNDESRVP